MSYELKIRREAKRKLRSLSAGERSRIIEKIMDLRQNPDSPDLDIIPLSGSPYWRLRVGGWRIIYQRQDILRILSVERIGARGDVYK